MKKFLALLMCFLLVFALAACGDGGKNDGNTGDDPSITDPDDPSDPDDPEDPDEPGKQEYTWNSEPVVTETFFDDFENGIDGTKWTSTNTGWGENNNGVSTDNVMYSTNKEKVEAEGATGGIVVLKATGDYAANKNEKREGAVLITRDDYGAGKYEVRMKVLPREGQCTAIWTYFNGTPNATDLEDSKYSEIDIELPEGGDFREMSATTYEKYIDKTNMNQTSSHFTLEEKGLDFISLNDGDWHTFAFEWRTDDDGERGIIWYIDDVPVVKYTTDVPVYTAPLWIGTHFPDNPSWLGVPNFETAYMYIDWVRITSYDEETIDESNGSEGDFTFTDLGNADIPQNNFISNGTFDQGTESSAVAWSADRNSTIVRGSENYVNYLQVNPGNTIYQEIDNQYKGHTLQLVVNAKITGGSGTLHVYLEEMYGGILSQGTSEEIEFRHTISGEKTLTYQIRDDDTDSIRVVFKTDEGTTAQITSVELYYA